MKITTYHAANTWVAFKFLIEHFGNDFIPPPPMTQEMLRVGFADAPEYACLPYKIFQGFFTKAIEHGAEGFFFFGMRNQRSCRFNDLTDGYQNAHPDKDFRVMYWGGRGLKYSFDRLRELARLGNKWKRRPSYPEMLYAIYVFMRILDEVDAVERLANYYCPRAKLPAEVENWRTASLKKWSQIGSWRDIKRTKKLVAAAASQLQIDRGKNVPRVLLAGDLFKIHDDFLHFDTMRRAAQLGLEVQRGMDLSDLFRGENHFPLPREKRFAYRQKLARPYLVRNPAGYTDITVGDAVHYCETGATGIIHFQSFNCMPDILVAPILDVVAKKYGVPIMHYLRDEHAADVGYQTRLEAFADVVKARLR